MLIRRQYRHDKLMNKMYIKGKMRSFEILPVPMEKGVYERTIKPKIRTLTTEENDWISLCYVPYDGNRIDKVSIVQANKVSYGDMEAYHVEIVVRSNNEWGWTGYCKDKVSYEETADIFKKVLVGFQDCNCRENWIELDHPHED